MLRRFISYIWLFTLAMVVPSQAFAYLLQAENEASARLSYRINTLLPASKSDAQALFDEVREDSQPKPITQSEFAQDWLAIVNTNRWLHSTRFVDDADSSSNLELPTFEPAIVALFRLYKATCLYSTNALATRYTSPSRIAGWKESNALYVALNAQYPVFL
ncbi:hypothetical protein [Vibrio sinaloensis]|uniref:hypothetical protein n=1 Tax=Photobacterium sp. (strain ATCC 43367) TaxID=379097 RepID=UPI0022AFA351|nr:hypothetical protein [Vibrio sinaloensis]MCZ4293276.1 hypothetical protein [Vibrio sinaloensis]